jgi:hypothetical protein
MNLQLIYFIADTLGKGTFTTADLKPDNDVKTKIFHTT